MPHYYLVISTAGPKRDLSKGTREQVYWDDHAAFIDGLVDEGFMVMGGPLADEGGAMIVVRAESEADVRERLREDPWYVHGVLQLESVRRWEIFVDELHRQASRTLPGSA
jgi:uncharacterized protein YciI